MNTSLFFIDCFHRRVEFWPLPDPKAYTTWMTPSVGIIDPTWVSNNLVNWCYLFDINVITGESSCLGRRRDSSLLCDHWRHWLWCWTQLQSLLYPFKCIFVFYLLFFDCRVAIAYEMGFTIPMSNVVFSGSHSHSGPGAISTDFLWSFVPATDLMGNIMLFLLFYIYL